MNKYTITFKSGLREAYSSKQEFLKQVLSLHKKGYIFSYNQYGQYKLLNQSENGILNSMNALRATLFPPHVKFVELKQY